MKTDDTKKERCLDEIYNRPNPQHYEIATEAADRVCMCKYCNGYLFPSTPCDKPKLPCRHWRQALYGALVALDIQERKDNTKK